MPRLFDYDIDDPARNDDQLQKLLTFPIGGKMLADISLDFRFTKSVGTEKRSRTLP